MRKYPNCAATALSGDPTNGVSLLASRRHVRASSLVKHPLNFVSVDLATGRGISLLASTEVCDG
jgi:hypothetical protein